MPPGTDLCFCLLSMSVPCETGCSASGFWRGGIGETDELLDAQDGVSSEDVEVVTTDASGYGGGAWWRLARAAWEFGEAERAPRVQQALSEAWGRRTVQWRHQPIWSWPQHGRMPFDWEGGVEAPQWRRRQRDRPQAADSHVEL